MAAFLAWAVRGRSAGILAPSVWRFPEGRRRVAVTFDDGPSESTPQVLALLQRYGARATFFVCGHNAQRLPDTLRAISRAGHEIGNHTWSHPRLDFASPQFMRQEIGRTQDVVSRITGRTPRFFRAPYGVRWFGLAAVQQELDLLGVMWTAIGRDWKLPGAAVARGLLPAARDGAILCLHDGRVLQERPDITSTLVATEAILAHLRDQSLSAVPVSAMLEP